MRWWLWWIVVITACLPGYGKNAAYRPPGMLRGALGAHRYCGKCGLEGPYWVDWIRILVRTHPVEIRYTECKRDIKQDDRTGSVSKNLVYSCLDF